MKSASIQHDNGHSRRRWALAAVSALAMAGMALTACTPGPATEKQAVAEPGHWAEQLIEGLDHPWAMTWLPNGDMLITERPGRLRVVRNGALDPKPIEGTPEVLNSSIFDGLLDVKPDPDFASNQTLFFTFVTGTDSARTGSILKARLDGHTLVDQKVIFSTSAPAPPGGPSIMRILFMPDKTMLVGVGSGGQGSRGMVQRLDNQSGKIIHLNRDGSAVANGPFSKEAGARPELWAIGFRNSAGIALGSDGNVWTIDIGPKGGDELNLVKPGGNYGWPLVSWGFDYSGRAMSDMQDGPDFVDPVAVWSPSRAPGDLMEYSGDRFPQWRGDFFASELMGHVLRRLRVQDGKVVQEEALLTDLRERIRSAAMGPDGYIYFITDSAKGRLLRLRPGKPDKAESGRVAKPYALPSGGNMVEDFARRGVYQEKYTQVLFAFKYDEAKAKALFGQNCSSCHSAGSFTTGEIGPDLNGVAKRRSGSLPGFAYSAALRDAKTAVQWDHDSLVAFISNPQSYYPGTKMMTAPIDDLETLLQITAFLEKTEPGKAGR
ncbi:MAG: PQQ-dependent sugar dehydrogenase [Sphingobium phenoxybenzoativorans]